MINAIEESGGVISHAADLLGCNRTTVYRYAEEYVTVQRAIDRYREQLVVEARDRMSDMMRNPDHRDHYRATLKILTVYDDDHDWSDRRRTDITSGGEPVTDIYFTVVHTDAEAFENEERSALDD
jgi:hypothetical protein